MNKPFEGRNRRRVFRLHLPSDARLKATIDGKEFEVIEVAELSLVVRSTQVTDEKKRFTGSIEWGDETTTEFSGEIGPVHNNDRTVIWKVKGIEMHQVIGEQRRMLWRQTEAAKAKKAAA